MRNTLLGWFVGQAMKASGGRASPQAVNEILKKKLGLWRARRFVRRYPFWVQCGNCAPRMRAEIKISMRNYFGERDGLEKFPAPATALGANHLALIRRFWSIPAPRQPRARQIP
jgi:hypothetical protein